MAEKTFVNVTSLVLLLLLSFFIESNKKPRDLTRHKRLGFWIWGFSIEEGALHDPPPLVLHGDSKLIQSAATSQQGC